MRNANPSGSRRAGFTLIEIAAVAAIFGFMITMFITKMDSMTPSARLRASARTVGSIVELAVSDAVIKGEIRKVVYDMRQGRLCIETEVPDERTGTAELMTKILPEDVRMKTVHGLDIEHDMAVLAVYPSGRTSPHAVQLENRAGGMTVQTFGITGRVAYYDGFVEMKEFSRDTE